MASYGVICFFLYLPLIIWLTFMDQLFINAALGGLLSQISTIFSSGTISDLSFLVRPLIPCNARLSFLPQLSYFQIGILII